MLTTKVFTNWFKAEVQPRWSKCRFEWIQMGDWHWRLRDFDVDTLTQAVRQHKACEDWREPSLKKVYDYAKEIRSRKSPPAPSGVEGKRQRSDHSGIPDAHTYIMCVEKTDNGRGCVGWFVPILIWPFHKTYTAETYRRIAEEQCLIHSRNGRAGVWKPFYNTSQLEMLRRSNRLSCQNPTDR